MFEVAATDGNKGRDERQSSVLESDGVDLIDGTFSTHSHQEHNSQSKFKSCMSPLHQKFFLVFCTSDRSRLFLVRPLLSLSLTFISLPLLSTEHRLYKSTFDRQLQQQHHHQPWQLVCHRLHCVAVKSSDTAAVSSNWQTVKATAVKAKSLRLGNQPNQTTSESLNNLSLPRR